MRIDIHSHVIAPAFADLIEQRTSFPVVEHRGGKRFIRSAPGLAVPVVAKLTDLDEKLAETEELGVDLTVLSHAVPGPEVLGGVEADEWAGRINDHLAGLVSRRPDRVAAWGMIGFGDPDRSRTEMERCVSELGLRGFQLYSNVRGMPLDTAQIVEVIEHAAELDVPLNLHPTVPLNMVGMEDLSILTGLGFVVDTSLAALRLIVSGLFDRRPDLKLIVPHVGGVLPYIHSRVAGHSGGGHIQGYESGLEHPIGHYLRMLYVDTITGDVASLRGAYELLGADRLLYGTDHPFSDYRESAAIVERLDVSDEERTMIYSGNARRILKLP